MQTASKKHTHTHNNLDKHIFSQNHHTDLHLHEHVRAHTHTQKHTHPNQTHAGCHLAEAGLSVSHRRVPLQGVKLTPNHTHPQRTQTKETKRESERKRERGVREIRDKKRKVEKCSGKGWREKEKKETER